MKRLTVGERLMQICVTVSQEQIEILEKIIKRYPNINSRSEAIRALILDWDKKHEKGGKNE